MRYPLALPLALALLAGRAPGQDPPPVPDGIDVQARGVLHEAYGDPGTVRAAPGVVIAKEPPKRIEELPPDDKPAGDNVVWVRGYWGWDEDAKDFVWVSGFWRVPPPGRTWMPGGWQKVADGWQWVAGYWTTPSATEVEYLPPPPESIERGPTIPVPDGQQNYVPGMWVWQTGRYLWRPGYFLAFRPGWVWVPGGYRWTPCGYVYFPGFWDRPLLERGVCFAPVRIAPRVYLARGFVYRPAYVIDPDFLVGAMFVRPGRSCYYFGDYFDVGYRRTYTPWVSYRPYRTVVDLNFGYYRFSFAKYRGWDAGVTGLYAARYAGDVPRPPQTLVAQTTIINKYREGRTLNTTVNRTVNITNVQNVTALRPLSRTTTLSATGLTGLAETRPAVTPVVREVRMERVSAERMAEERRAIERDQALAVHRRETMTSLAAKTPATGLTAPVKVKLDLPKGTPPARAVRATTVPAEPTHPKFADPRPPVKDPTPPVRPVVKDPPMKPPVVKDPPPPVRPPVVKDPPPVRPPVVKDPPPPVKPPVVKDPPPPPVKPKGTPPGKKDGF